MDTCSGNATWACDIQVPTLAVPLAIAIYGDIDNACMMYAWSHFVLMQSMLLSA